MRFILKFTDKSRSSSQPERYFQFFSGSYKNPFILSPDVNFKSNKSTSIEFDTNSYTDKKGR